MTCFRVHWFFFCPWLGLLMISSSEIFSSVIVFLSYKILFGFFLSLSNSIFDRDFLSFSWHSHLPWRASLWRLIAILCQILHISLFIQDYFLKTYFVLLFGPCFPVSPSLITLYYDEHNLEKTAIPNLAYWLIQENTLRLVRDSGSLWILSWEVCILFGCVCALSQLEGHVFIRSL